MSQLSLIQLRAFINRYPTARKILFVPSWQTGYNLSSALALNELSWVNLVVTTPIDYASAIARPHLMAEGWKPLPADAGNFFVEELLPDVLNRDEGGYFSQLPLSPGLVRIFMHSLNALRTAGITAEQYENSDLDRTKTKPLAMLHRSYETFLRVHRYFDNSILLEYALAHASASPNSSGEVYAILEDTVLSPLAYQLVHTVANGNLCLIEHGVKEASLPATCAGVRFSKSPAPGFKSLSTNGNDRTLRLTEAIGTENEIRGVLRDILSRGIPLDTVEIAYTIEQPYVSLLLEAADRYGIPIGFAGGIPIMCRVPGQALKGFFRWISSGYEVMELKRLLRAYLISFNQVLQPGETAEPFHAAAFITRTRLRQGRRSVLQALDLLQEQMKMEGSDRTPELSPIRLNSCRRILAVLFSLLPEQNSLPMSELVTAAIRFLELFVPLRSEIDHKALASLRDRLREIGNTIVIEDQVARLAIRLSEVLASHKVGASVAHPGELYASPLERAGYTRRPNLYVVGVDESCFPGNISEDPILLDEDRSRLSSELELSHSRPGETLWHLHRLLEGGVGTVMLIACRRNLADGRETYPAAVFQKWMHDLDIRTPERFVFVAEGPRCLDETELLLACRNLPGSSSAIRSYFPDLSTGFYSLQERSRDALTRFNGWLGGETPELDILSGDRVVSASQLEMLSRCPYRYFLHYVLGIEPFEDEEPDPSRWLDASSFGKLVHELFFAFMEVLRHRRERCHAGIHKGLMRELLSKHIQGWRERIEPPNEAAFRADIKRLERASRVFLTSESERHDAEPVGFEVSFGFGHSGSFHRPDPIRIRLSDRIQFRLCGRIDRVDRSREGFEIWDYKTGSARPFKEGNLLKNMIHLQWALYAHALGVILREQGIAEPVCRSGYFFTSDREHGRRAASPPPLAETLAAKFEPLRVLVENGCFFHVQKEDQCTYCDFNPLCSAERRLPEDLTAITTSMSVENPPFLTSLIDWLVPE